MTIPSPPPARRLASPALRAEIRRTLSLAAPVVLTQLSLMGMGLCDTLMVGPLGPVPLGAVVLGRSVFFTVALFVLGVIAGSEPIIGQAFGASRREGCGRTLWQAIWLAVLLGVLLTLGLRDLRWAFTLAGQKPAIVEAASTYLGCRAFASVPFLLFAAHRSFLNGVGDTRAVLAVALAGNAVNVVANYALIYGHFGFAPHGIAGAGIASAASTAYMAGHVAWLVFRSGRYREFGLRPDWPSLAVLWRIVGIGTPIGLQVGAEVGVFAAAAFLMGRLGEVPLAAHTAAIMLVSTTFMVPLGVGVAASVRVAQRIGASDPGGASLAGKVSIGLGASFMACSALVFLVAPAPLVRLFTHDPAVVAVGCTLVRIAAAFQVADGLQVVSAFCLRGAADTRTPMVVNLLAHWGLGLPLGWLLAFRMGVGASGVWVGLTVSLVVVAAVLVRRFLRGRWRKIGPVSVGGA